mgnify:FL=1
MPDIEALILTTVEYKDSSKILNLYTKEGFKSVIAHGVKKHNSLSRYLSQQCTIIKCSNPFKELSSLKDASLLNEFENIKKDPLMYLYMTHILELLKNTVNEDANHEKMYGFITRLLQKVNDTNLYHEYAYIFELKLLHFIGYGLQFKKCSICSKTDDLVFAISSGGLVCKEHLDDIVHTYDESVYSVLKYLYYVDINSEIERRLSDSERIIIRHILDVLYDEFISFHTKSMKIIKQFEKY